MMLDELNGLDSRLIDAADHGDTKAVKTLLAARADVPAKNEGALCWAAENGHAKTVKILLAAGADVHAQNDWALRSAACWGRTETVKVLLAAGANVHGKDDCALRRAAYFGHTETLRVLARHIFAADSWRGKSRAEIEAGASGLYDKIKANIPSNPIKPERLRETGHILIDAAIDCWHQVRPPPKLTISPLPAQPRPL